MKQATNCHSFCSVCYISTREKRSDDLCLLLVNSYVKIISSSLGLQDRQLSILAIKVASCSSQMSSDVVINFLGLSSVCQKDFHKVHCKVITNKTFTNGCQGHHKTFTTRSLETSVVLNITVVVRVISRSQSWDEQDRHHIILATLH